MRYLSNEAIRDEILEGMHSQDIDETELAIRLDTSVENIHEMLSHGYNYSVEEIQTVLGELDLSLRFEVAPF